MFTSLLQEVASSIENEKKLKQKLDEIKVDFFNITNDLNVCRNEIITYENQMAKEREKLCNVKEENKQLCQKVCQISFKSMMVCMNLKKYFCLVVAQFSPQIVSCFFITRESLRWSCHYF